MTLRRFKESRALGGSPMGGGLMDPAAIPPPNYNTMSRAGVPVTAHTSMQVDVVHTAMRVLSNAIIKMGNLRGYKTAFDGQGRPYKLWQNPQPKILTSTFGNMWQYDGRRRTVISMALFGEAFWFTLTRDFYGFPTALEVLNPLLVTVKADKATGNPIYKYGFGANQVDLDPEAVTHIPFMAMPGAARGLSAIEYAGIQLALSLAALEYGLRWFSQGASPSFLLTTDAKVGKDELTRIAETFLVEHAGLQAAHLPMVLDGGMKAQKISSTPDEAQYLNTLEYARTSLASYFGLPSHLVGGMADKGNVWGKTVQEQGYQLVDFTLSGYTVPLEEAHASMLPRGQGASFDEKAILKANAADLAAEITAYRSTAVQTANDIRVDYLGLPPVDGGDDLNAPLNSNVSPAASVAAASTEDDAGSGGGGQ